MPAIPASPSSAPAVTVATSVYNAAQTLGPAIESVLAQTFGDFEFLILDDGSTDDSLAIAQAYAARDPRVRPIAMPRQGLVRSLNQLFAQARAPLVARFDADDICMPERLARQVAFLAEHPDHGLVACETTFIDETGAPAPNPPIQRPHDHAAILAALEHGPILCHSAVMVRTDLVRAAGGYREVFIHAEDYDLWLRLASETRMANLAECMLAYRITPGQVSSRHVVAQARNAAIAWLAHGARARTGSDPIAELSALPTLDMLDGMFGAGSAAYVRQRMIDRLLYAPDRLAGEAWPVLLGHIADGAPRARLWRTAIRLLKAGHPLRAVQTAIALARQAA